MKVNFGVGGDTRTYEVYMSKEIRGFVVPGLPTQTTKKLGLLGPADPGAVGAFANLTFRSFGPTRLRRGGSVFPIFIPNLTQKEVKFG